jgi:hypothetical protein
VALGVDDRGGGLTQRGDDLPGPVLVGGVQLEDTLAVADEVLCPLPDVGELGVELVPAGVVVADQVAGVTLQDAQIGDGGLGPGADRGVVDQPRVGGAHGDRVRRCSLKPAGLATPGKVTNPRWSGLPHGGTTDGRYAPAQGPPGAAHRPAPGHRSG